MKLCSVEECPRKRQARGWCKIHWQQWRRHGKLLDFNYRLPNKITVCDNIATIELYKGFTNEVIGETKIDAEDVDKIKDVKWHLTETGYVKRGLLPLASAIMGDPWIDHINGNRLDNRKVNLRRASPSQNSMNRGLDKKSKSARFKGVCRVFKHKTNPFKAYISYERQRIHIGSYATGEEAAWMYDQFALELHQEFARTNFHYLETPLASH